MSLENFEARFSVLDAIPENLFSAVVTHTHGTLLTRARGLLQWRDALLAGRLPDEKSLCWPEEKLRRVILKRLEALDIVRHCRDEPGLTDDVLESILEGVASAEDYFCKAGDFDDELARRQKIRDRDSEFEDDEGVADHVDGQGNDGTSPQGEETSSGEDASLPSEAAMVDGGDDGGPVSMAEAAVSESEGRGGGERMSPELQVGDDTATGDFSDDVRQGETGEKAAGSPPDPIADVLEKRWGELAMSWRELSSVLDELGAFLGRGWDLTRGILATGGWRDIVHYRRLLADLPELKKLVAILGRMQGEKSGDGEQSMLEAISDPLQREPEETPIALADHAIDTTEGVRLSDDVARMLPAESALLGHEKLNTLWHARRAESMLRCYQLQGVLSQHTPQPEPEPEKPADSGDTPGHGPVIVCLDSSASMAGQPETIAKAVTLEALRIAGAEKRDCLVISFSGEGQTMQWRLDFSRRGYRELIDFLRQSFHGGTDVAGALRVALDQFGENEFRQADILLISDGRFPLPEEQLPNIEKIKNRQSARIHGLLIGRWRSDAMQRLCDPLHRFDVWNVELSEE